MTVHRRSVLVLPVALALPAGVLARRAEPGAAVPQPDGAELRLAWRRDESVGSTPRLWVGFGRPTAVEVDGWRLTVTLDDLGGEVALTLGIADPLAAAGAPVPGYRLRLGWNREATVPLERPGSPRLALDLTVRRATRPA